jgi:hypothetical protein
MRGGETRYFIGKNISAAGNTRFFQPEEVPMRTL